MSDPVNVLDVDTALADLIPHEQRAQARQALGAATIEFDVGSWTEPVDSDAFRGGYGLLVFEGLMLRRARIPDLLRDCSRGRMNPFPQWKSRIA